MIIGGKNVPTYNENAGYSTSVTVVMPDGTQCNEPSLPNLPKRLEGFGTASRKNRYSYVCGGIERSVTSGKKHLYILKYWLF